MSTLHFHRSNPKNHTKTNSLQRKQKGRKNANLNRAIDLKSPPQTPADVEAAELLSERANTLSHGAGVLASIIGGTFLIVKASLTRDPWKIVSVSIFVATLILLYSASTLYHATRRPHVKQHLKVLDHASIYLLIAGSYTPFTLVGLRGGWGWSLFGTIWGLAIGGVIFKFFAAGRFKLISTGIYVVMGWLVIIAIKPMIHVFDPAVLLWLLAGGLAYTGGTLFYHNHRLLYSHAVWHGFVICGSVCHAVAVGLVINS
ncbi:hemolysin III family protein [Kiritimatiellota bacterium B12222]|nr:hemolysin III family protein [Kiritimatiellota bacterium B12222]